MPLLPYRNREEAARYLSEALSRFRGERPVVLAIPRGAVPMGRIVADALDGELDVVLVRKLGAPGNPELAIGSVDEAGRVALNEIAERIGDGEAYIQREAQRQLALIRERRQRYAAGQPGLELAGRTVIVLDDGLATGATMVAALRAARSRQPARLICAVPVAAADSLAEVAVLADEVVCLATPSPFYSVGLHYRRFDQVTDDDVVKALGPAPAPNPAGTAVPGYPVRIACGTVVMDGDLHSPPSPRGMIIFAHGSGSSRHSPRNRAVAEALNRRGFATLLFDLLTPKEDRDPSRRFDIPLLAQRLDAAVAWAQSESAQRGIPLGLFGASTGAGAAMVVAAARRGEIAAVVSRGGRPDLAGRATLTNIRTPTLLIVGGNDPEVRSLNRLAEVMMRPWAVLATVPGATHLFEEPGALEQVATLAADWFDRWFAQDAAHGHDNGNASGVR